LLTLSSSQFDSPRTSASIAGAEWCHYLEEFPLYAIRKAAKWTVVGRDKLPSVATFIADVKLAIGDGVLERRRLLARISNPSPSIISAKLEVE